MTTPTRRQILQGAAAAALVPPALAPQAARAAVPPAEVDVAVIGAGLAGLACAALVQERGRSVAVLEARPRLGGRAHTDLAALGLPVDLGAAVLRSTETNPLAAELRRREIPLATDDGDLWLFDADGSGQARDAGVPDYDSLAFIWDRVDDALLDARALRADVALAARLNFAAPGFDPRWADTARALAGPLHVGTDFASVAALDAPRLSGSGTDALLPGGLGTAAARLAAGLPVFTGRAATRVDWSASRAVITLAGPEAELRAGIVVVTLPLGVLAATGGPGAVQFEPALPATQREALGRMPMGRLERIALAYAPATFEAPANTQALLRVAGPRAPAMSLRLNAFGQAGLVVAAIGGDYARDLAAKGTPEMIAAARAQVRLLFGEAADAGFRGGTASAWSSDPYSRGAIALTRPGFTAARRAAGRALTGPGGRARVLFAGEAFAPADWTGSAAGAWVSGRQAAADALRLLG